MSIWSTIKSFLTIDEYYIDQIFSLGDRPPYLDEPQKEQAGDQPAKNKKSTRLKQPIKTTEMKEHKKLDDPYSEQIYTDLDLNVQKTKIRFNMPPNADLIIREFAIPLDPPVNLAIAFMEGLASRDTINSHVLQPLMILSNLDEIGHNKDVIDIIKERLLPGNQVETKESFKDLIDGILTGTTMVLVDGYPTGLLVETKGWEHRTVSRPTSENVVRGPQESFVEHIRVNTALIRKRIKSNNLVTEMFKLGRLSNTDCAILYLERLTNPKLVREIRTRIKTIDTDYITDSGTLEQFIEDNPTSIVPGQLVTERPDRAAAALSEGRVVIIVDGDPFVLIIPISIWGLIHSAEDFYIRWPYGTLLRGIRVLALFLNLLLPSFYISIINYHPEMIPSDLLLSIAASRETIPFPAIWEIALMELSFELIREAGIRIPSLIGPTLGIVGALILGQAAVAANIISPLMVIIVALTGLGSFAIPNYSFSLAMRTLRFIFLILSAMLGFYGLAIGIFIVIIAMCGHKSLGVPVLSPVTPYRPPSGDVILRKAVFLQEHRPWFLRPQDRMRQAKITRPWHPVSKNLENSEQQTDSQGDSEGGQPDV